MPDQTENEIVNEIIEYLQWLGHVVVRTYVKGIKGKRNRHYDMGTSDLIVCLKPTGLFVGLEVKRKHGRVLGHQETWLQKVRSCGGYGYVVRSVSDVQRAIETITSTKGE